jgi:hypothetical protein
MWNNPCAESVEKVMNNSRRLLLFLPMLLSAVALSAQSHSNFTGTWKYAAAKSDKSSGAPTDLLIEVDHKDPVFKYHVRGIAGGQPIDEAESFTTDGKASRDAHGINVTASWDGEALVAVGTADDGSMVYVARLTLSSDGKNIIRVFTTKDDPELRHEIYDKQ